jgi:hypothetical protein
MPVITLALAFGVAGAIDRGPDGQCQVLDVTDSLKGPRRVPRRCRSEFGATSTAVAIEVPIGVIAQAAVRGVRTRAPLSV